ncbi:hypothetical protein [Pseudobutyrivibrio sp.]|uniref:hypothetical protein n=1 Tax=Pseudobutyrivibrio sp. TaxID=2014367 RepID=UPI0025FD9B1A|nr:hypothetical protein [Pseudobutyrivibrio sp.]MBR5650068.1 hypothetical protein [Pseudobutyrivibrio sp.]
MMQFHENEIVRKNDKGVVSYYLITNVNSSNYHGIRGRILRDSEVEFLSYPYKTVFQPDESCRELLKQFFCIKKYVITPISEDNLEIVGKVETENIHKDINEAFEKLKDD